MTPASKTILVLGLPLVALLCLGGALGVAALWRGTSPVHIRYDLAAGRNVVITVPEADFTLRPSTDGRVHITATGSYAGSRPTLLARASNAVTTIDGRGCYAPAVWFRRCSLDVTVAIPQTSQVRVDTSNGDISAAGLTGALDLGTTNGNIHTSGTQAGLHLRSGNGNIQVLAATSQQATAHSTNGNISMAFTRSPATITATSTNGNINVGVPTTGVSYFLNVHTSNGTNSSSVDSDRTSGRTITARTTNGNVTIAPA